VGCVTTLRSDNNPNGIEQRGTTLHPQWEVLTPPHQPSDTCKAVAFVRKQLMQSITIKTQPDHPLSNLNSLVFDVVEDEQILLQIINVYHKCPKSGHNLQYLFNHNLNELVPTLIMGNFNTHTVHWSLSGHASSAWADDFTDWLDINNLSICNPPGEAMWKSLNK
jgi:hypothetical protein